MTLIEMMLAAPLIGVLQRWPKKLHAVTMDGVPLNGGLAESACGIKGLRLMPTEVDGQKVPAPWPPRVKGMPDGYDRCRDCFEATGRMRPRVDWRDS